MRGENGKPRTKKIRSLTIIRKLNIIKNIKLKKILKAKSHVAGEVAEAGEPGEAGKTETQQHTIREILIDLGLEQRYLKMSLNNYKSTGTALTRLDSMVTYYLAGSPTRNDILSFFLNLTPERVEKYANYVSEVMGRSPSTIYSILIGLCLSTTNWYYILYHIIYYFYFNCFYRPPKRL
jgi:hypothetical protein